MRAPAAVVAELDSDKFKFASGELKLNPTQNDARGGK